MSEQSILRTLQICKQAGLLGDIGTSFMDFTGNLGKSVRGLGAGLIGAPAALATKMTSKIEGLTDSLGLTDPTTNMMSDISDNLAAGARAGFRDTTAVFNPANYSQLQERVAGGPEGSYIRGPFGTRPSDNFNQWIQQTSPNQRVADIATTGSEIAGNIGWAPYMPASAPLTTAGVVGNTALFAGVPAWMSYSAAQDRDEQLRQSIPGRTQPTEQPQPAAQPAQRPTSQLDTPIPLEPNVPQQPTQPAPWYSGIADWWGGLGTGQKIMLVLGLLGTLGGAGTAMAGRPGLGGLMGAAGLGGLGYVASQNPGLGSALQQAVSPGYDYVQSSIPYAGDIR